MRIAWPVTVPAGSSPRVRGKLADRVAGHGARGIIPARAGKTGGGRCGGPPRADHPRACGENEALAASDATDKGSSPRVRGKRNECTGHPVVQGIIPARAGKTAPTSMTARSRTDHPRACGENWAPWTRVSTLWGSSPRVRGKLLELLGDPGAAGIIPARAGKTADRHYTASLTTDHPRACGENVTWDPAIADRPGSSPRVRGKHAFAPWDDCPAGIIPARAGKTSRTTSASGSATDHPRACGENRLRGFSRVRAWGSSPRVRGKLLVKSFGFLPHRIIPARAGKTRTCSSAARTTRDHPRACGENERGSVKAKTVTGSSPRVRGKPTRSTRSTSSSGIIPARAGKTSNAAPNAHPTTDHPRACGENLRLG